MKYEWKQYIFTPEDFEGAGQYIVREGYNKLKSPYINDTGYLSTVIQKIGWTNNIRPFEDKEATRYMLIDMSDGLIFHGYFTNTRREDEPHRSKPVEEWKWNEFSGKSNAEAKQKLCDYLNENPDGETFRFATNEELIRVAAYQKYRTK